MFTEDVIHQGAVLSGFSLNGAALSGVTLTGSSFSAQQGGRLVAGTEFAGATMEVEVIGPRPGARPSGLPRRRPAARYPPEGTGMMPQAMRAPEFPVGWVVKSSTFWWMIKAWLAA